MFSDGDSASIGPRNIERKTRGMTFVDILQARALELSGKQAFVFLDAQGTSVGEYTFAALDLRARAIAAELIENDLSEKRVLLIFPPGLDFVAALFGCFYASAVAVPVPFLPGKRIAERIGAICRDADPAAVLTLSRLRSEPQILQASFGIEDSLIWIYIDALDSKSLSVDLPLPTPEALALLQYTSGSTTAPKGVMLSHDNLIANSEMIATAFGHSEMSRGVGWLPPFHDMGLVGHILQPVYFGGLSVLMSPLVFLQRPVRWLQAISNWKATTSGGPTFAFELCLRSVRDEQLDGVDLSSWNVAYCGSEKVRTDVLDRFCARFERNGFQRRSLLPCFGLAEATLLVAGARSEAGVMTAYPVAGSNYPNPAVSCGPPARGSTISIVDLETRARLEDGSVGEIWVQGPHVARGYWRCGNCDDELFRVNFSGGSGGPYLRTGDLGFMKFGQLFVVGRLKDTIILHGVTRTAEDIEAVAMRSHDIFAGCPGAAFSVDFGETEHAVLVQEIRPTRFKPEELAEAVTHALASVTREHGVRLLDLMVVRAGSVPRTSNGKVRRSQARITFLAGGFERLNPNSTLKPEGSISHRGTST
jgi:acyl-CoA synthetase (AMP-forming)/AMP-acid ligase II